MVVCRIGHFEGRVEGSVLPSVIPLGISHSFVAVGSSVILTGVSPTCVKTLAKTAVTTAGGRVALCKAASTNDSYTDTTLIDRSGCESRRAPSSVVAVMRSSVRSVCAATVCNYLRSPLGHSLGRHVVLRQNNRQGTLLQGSPLTNK